MQEADPTADVEGYDACRKIAILSSLAYERYFDFEDIYTEGITKITPEDMGMLRSLAEPSNFLEPAVDWQTEPVMQW